MNIQKENSNTKKGFKRKTVIISFIYAAAFAVLSNSYGAVWGEWTSFTVCVLIFAFLNLAAGMFSGGIGSFRLKICYHGGILLTSLVTSAVFSFLFQIIYGIIVWEWKEFLFSVLFCFVAHAIIFWNGIFCVYIFSLQLGIKHRILGIVFGLVPFINIIMLRRIIKTVFEETVFENEKNKLNQKRKEEQICKTKYPILMIHGVFFRDSKYFNYWGRIPKELKKNGATIYYGNHQSALSIPESASELAKRIETLAKTTGADKFNIIAHSKGGLDCRYAVNNYNIAPYVASITTVNTPHKGCQFAEYLLNNLSADTKNAVASKYDKTLKKLGDESPDFLAAVDNLTASASFDDEKEKFQGIFCQSVGSVLKKASGGKFPLNFSYFLVKHFDGKNDGLVSEHSFPWGEKYTLLAPKGKNGISHGDMIDLHRINVEDFDVREFYVQLVKDLKDRGL